MSTNSLSSFRCSQCSGDGNTNEHGTIDIWRDEWCEVGFCSERCFQLHACSGHEAEIALCLGCGAEIDLTPGLFSIDEDPLCSECKLVSLERAV